MWNKMAISKFGFVDFGGKMSVGGGLGRLPSNFFGHLKRALKLFIFVKMSPFVRFYDPMVDTMTPGKKNNNNNKHAPVICLLAKKYKIPHFCR